MNQEYDYLFKMVIIGNSSVGKSSLLLRFSDKIFNENFLPTIGVDFKIRTFPLNGKTVKTQIWDTAGQERFKTITSSYYKGAQGVIVVFDVTDAVTFREVENWLGEVHKHGSPEIVNLLGPVGNKVDLVDKRQVTEEEAREFASQRGMQYIETSAKDNVNVDEAFIRLATLVKQKVPDQEEDDQQEHKRRKLKSTTDLSNKKNKCC